MKNSFYMVRNRALTINIISPEVGKRLIETFFNAAVPRPPEFASDLNTMHIYINVSLKTSIFNVRKARSGGYLTP